MPFKLVIEQSKSSSTSSKSNQIETPKSTSNEKQKLPNGYEFIQVLGSGAFGQVIKALDKKNNKLVAIKLQRFPEHDKIFQKEIENLKKVANDCKNLVCIVDSGYFYKKHYIVMEFISGKSLTEYAKQEKNNVILLESIYKQLILAVKKLHSFGMAHMDIKSDNIIIDSNGDLHLVDLGLSCFIDGKCVGGTKKYISPDLGFDDFTVKGRQQDDMWAIGYSLAKVLNFEYYARQVYKDIENNHKTTISIPEIKSEYLKQILKLLSPIKDRVKIFKKLSYTPKVFTFSKSHIEMEEKRQENRMRTFRERNRQHQPKQLSELQEKMDNFKQRNRQEPKRLSEIQRRIRNFKTKIENNI